MSDLLVGRRVKLGSGQDEAIYTKNSITGENFWIQTHTGQKLGPPEKMWYLVGRSEKIDADVKNEKINESFFTMNNIILIRLIIGIIVIIFYAIYENYKNYKKKEKNK